MTAVKHPFELPDSKQYRRFRTETLRDITQPKVSKICQEAVNPTSFPAIFASRNSPYVVPAPASWFDFKKVHPIELREFPELEDKTILAEYTAIRNKLVQLYRLFPTDEVTTSVVRHVYGGNFAFIKKIHQFLAKWGLINFLQVFPAQETLSKPDTSLLQAFCKVYDDSGVITPPTTRINLPCTICKSDCSEHHFLSKKYPGLFFCLRCFAHRDSLTQSNIQHKSFEYRSIDQPQPQPKNNINFEKKIFEEFCKAVPERKTMFPDEFYRDWTQIMTSLRENPQTAAHLTMLECFVYILRSSLTSGVIQKTLMNHEFKDIDTLNELLLFISEDPVTTVDELPPKQNWEAMESELEQIELENKNVWSASV